jgi:hypothetical protein
VLRYQQTVNRLMEIHKAKKYPAANTYVADRTADCRQEQASGLFFTRQMGIGCLIQASCDHARRRRHVRYSHRGFLQSKIICQKLVHATRTSFASAADRGENKYASSQANFAFGILTRQRRRKRWLLLTSLWAGLLDHVVQFEGDSREGQERLTGLVSIFRTLQWGMLSPAPPSLQHDVAPRERRPCAGNRSGSRVGTRQTLRGGPAAAMIPSLSVNPQHRHQA